MYIKEITLDGFKSYAQQTVLSNFDPHFNAITGLNGSGKSNVLDSICFLLGISNLSQVRATNLQELIYKGGNAGITRATVSITFDNMDKNQSPPGYHEYEEITITRQVFYLNWNIYLYISIYREMIELKSRWSVDFKFISILSQIPSYRDIIAFKIVFRFWSCRFFFKYFIYHSIDLKELNSNMF